MVEKHQRQPQQQDSSGGAQQPDHTLVNLLGNRAQIPGRGRGHGGRTGQTGGVQATGTFLTCAFTPEPTSCFLGTL